MKNCSTRGSSKLGLFLIIIKFHNSRRLSKLKLSCSEEQICFTACGWFDLRFQVNIFWVESWCGPKDDDTIYTMFCGCSRKALRRLLIAGENCFVNTLIINSHHKVGGQQIHFTWKHLNNWDFSASNENLNNVEEVWIMSARKKITNWVWTFLILGQRTSASCSRSHKSKFSLERDFLTSKRRLQDLKLIFVSSTKRASSAHSINPANGA